MARPTLSPAGFFRRLPLLPHQLNDRITRTEDVIVLCHLGVPRVEAESWTLDIGGLVDQGLRLDLSALKTRPKVELTSIHQCAGSPLQPDVPTRRICNVVWGGVRLADLLAECGVRPEARYVWSSGADYGAFENVPCDPYVKDLPIERVPQDVLVAYEMNGAPLPPENGFPARLVVPGFYGTNSVKWLSRIELCATRATGPFTTRWYNDPVRDDTGMPTTATTPVWSIAPESVIVAPAPAETVSPGAKTEIWGWAWGDGGIAAVDVSVDGGSSWMSAALEPAAGRTWQRFVVRWCPDRVGSVTLLSRASDWHGRTQPAAGARNARHAVEVVVG